MFETKLKIKNFIIIFYITIKLFNKCIFDLFIFLMNDIIIYNDVVDLCINKKPNTVYIILLYRSMYTLV